MCFDPTVRPLTLSTPHILLDSSAQRLRDLAVWLDGSPAPEMASAARLAADGVESATERDSTSVFTVPFDAA